MDVLISKFLKQISTNLFVIIRANLCLKQKRCPITSDSVFNLKPNLCIIERLDRVTIPIPQLYQYTTECWLPLRLLALLHQHNQQI